MNLLLRPKLAPCLLCLGLVAAQAAHAFDLFDPERGKEKTVEAPPPPPKAEAPPPPPPKPKAPPPPQKDFTLEGTSRIGPRYSVLLQTPDGKHISQRLKAGKPVPIKGYEEYKLLAVEPRKAQIAYPENSPCRTSNSQRGIQCSADGKSATLSLQAGKPLPAQPPSMPISPSHAPPGVPVLSSPEDAIPPGQPGGPPLNPAVQQLQAELQKRQMEAQAQPPPPGGSPLSFQPQRIRDEDVPPGMRVIRTPFGDRLVPSQP